MGPRSTRTSAPPAPRAPARRAAGRPPPRSPAAPRRATVAGALGAVGGHRAPRALRSRHAPQAPAGAVVPAAHGHRCGAWRAWSRCSRSTSPGVALAIFTALVLKEVVTATSTREQRLCTTTEHFLPFAYLLTALLFARSGLYAERGAAPRALADRRLAVPGRVRRADLRGRQRRTLLQLLPLLRLARVRALLRRPRSAAATSASPACCCAPPATGAARCWSARQAHRATSPTRSRRRAALADRGRRLPRRRAPLPGERPALARVARRPRRRCSAASASTR